MAELTDDQRAAVRTEIGDTVPPSDAELNEIFTRRGGLVGVVREVWTKRRANLLATPGSFTVPGDYAQSTTANLRELRYKLDALAGLADDSNDLSVLIGKSGRVLGQLTRTDASR